MMNSFIDCLLLIIVLIHKLNPWNLSIQGQIEMMMMVVVMMMMTTMMMRMMIASFIKTR